MGILKNATDSIAIGMEDYSSPDARRLLSCVRNLYAGILLLFKHKLASISPNGSDEVLLKSRVLPFKVGPDIIWRGVGRNTVDFKQIKERFDKLGVKVDWGRMYRIQEYRNDIEHYHSSQTHQSVRTMVAETFIIIRDFIRQHLNEDPRSLLGQQAYDTMVDEAEVFEKERGECEQSILSIDWKYKVLEYAMLDMNCPACSSELLFAIGGKSREDSQIICRSCKCKWDFIDIAEMSIVEYMPQYCYSTMGIKEAEFILENETPLVIDCPLCNRETYISRR